MPKRKRNPKALSAIAEGCCVLCRYLGIADDSPALCHHPREGTGTACREDDADAIPLCPAHHDAQRGPGAYHLRTGNVGAGERRHAAGIAAIRLPVADSPYGTAGEGAHGWANHRLSIEGENSNPYGT